MSLGGWVAVALLGGAGAVLRYAVDAAIAVRTGPALPWGIFAVNVTGAFALGVLAGADAGPDALRLAGTALIGAYTTFSTWMLQARVLLRDGRSHLAVTYVVASLLAGLGAVALGRGVA